MSALVELRFMPFCSPLSVPHQIEQKKEIIQKGIARINSTVKTAERRV